MAQDASQLRTGANGNVYVAPFGTTAPTTPTAAYGAGWIDIGFTTEQGIKFKDSKTIRDQTAWQSFYPVGKKVTARSADAMFELKQWNKTTVAFAFGGGTITTVSSGVYKFQPPSPETVDYRTLGVDWVEGTIHYRLIIAKGLAADAVETTIARTDDAILPINFSVVGVAGSDPWIFLNDDPAFA